MCGFCETGWLITCSEFQDHSLLLCLKFSRFHLEYIEKKEEEEKPIRFMAFEIDLKPARMV